MSDDVTMTQDQQQAPLPRWKRALYMGITLSLPLALLLVAEIVLRLFGWGGYPAFIREAGRLPQGGTLCIVEPAASRPYFYANPTRPGYADQSSFVMPKPPGTVRIFLIGESAAKGYPQPPNLAMSAFLQSMLQRAWPDRQVEVINLGTTAIASFPVIYQVRDALRFSPDLFVLYVGNNEFFGAYGTASINGAGALPQWAVPLVRAARGLALVQSIDGLFRKGADANRTLMEQMIGQTVIPLDSPLRAAAADNLRMHLGRALADIGVAGVPAIVCTTASNESGLAPLGEDDLGGMSDAQRAEFERLMKAASDPVGAGLVNVALRVAEPVPAPAVARVSADALRKAVALAPRSAMARFELARALAASGDATAAREAFLEARDLDTMPWRPTRATEQAIRDAAKQGGATLCDVAERFRGISPEGATGWSLLDDHVHPSLQGQVEVARSVVQAMADLPGSLRVDPALAAALPDWNALATAQGVTAWDAYAVNHTLRTLFGVPFMRRRNEAAFARFDGACKAVEVAQSPSVRETLREWHSSVPHAGGKRPLTGMVGRVMLRENRVADALPLYQAAQRQVPSYTSWYLEYVYFELACRQVLQGSLGEPERARAAEAIAQAKFLLANGFSESGFTERYAGRLHQLRGEWAEALPFLLAARPKMAAEDLVACDQALVDSYRMTGNRAAAVALTEDGMRNAGKFAPIYKQLRAKLGP